MYHQEVYQPVFICAHCYLLDQIRFYMVDLSALVQDKIFSANNTICMTKYTALSKNNRILTKKALEAADATASQIITDCGHMFGYWFLIGLKQWVMRQQP